uniref:Uncharacterized protein n=1 Tax=Alexandrium monilatum TaxID=311494 RepID=A0A7S4RLE1_9DINO
MSFESFLRPGSASFQILKKLEERHACSALCFPCLRQQSERELVKLVKTFGENDALDEEHEHMDFSLFSGAYISPYNSETVELEYTKAHASNRMEMYEIEMSRAKQLAAAARLRKFYEPIVPLGCALYALTLGGGYWSGRSCDCSDGPSVIGFSLPALAIILQVCVLNRITILLSQTEVEGRPLLRLLSTLSGFDNYYVMTALCLADTFSRFTRAQFVGYIAHCHSGVDAPFTELFEGYGRIQDFMAWMGIAGLAHVSFITGPILIQFGYMLCLNRKIRTELKEADGRFPGEDMEVMDSVDDLAALMNWAMLAPAGKVLEMAALPLNLDGDEDVERLWDGMKTKVYVYLARDIPDGIMQMNLQAFFFCIVFQQVAWSVRLQLLLNIVLAGGPVLLDSVDLLLMNRVLTVLPGLVMLVLVVFFGGYRAAGAFFCDSHLTGVFGQVFTCLPVGEIDVGNWSSGELPG